MTRQPGLLAGVLLTVFAFAFEMIGVATALPHVMEEFQAKEHYAWAFTIMTIGTLFATVAAGRLADSKGPLPPLILGLLFFAGGTLLASLAPSITVLLLGRFLQGLGAGGLNLGLFVVVALAFDGAQRASAMAAVSFAWVLPAFIGPLISAWVTQAWSWRWVFAGVLPLLLLGAVVSARPVLRIQRSFQANQEPQAFPLLGAVALAVSPALIQLSGQLTDWWVVVSAVSGLGVLAFGLPRVLPKQLFPWRRGLGAVALTRAAQAGGFMAGEAFLLMVLRELRGLDLFAAGLALTIGSLGWTVGSWLQSQAWHGLSRDGLISWGSRAGLVGMLGVLWFVSWAQAPLALAIISWVIAGTGMGLMMSSTAVATMSLSQTQEQGRNSSALQVADVIGNALLTGLAGAIYVVGLGIAPRVGYSALFAMLALVLLLVALWANPRIGYIRNDSIQPIEG